MPFQHLPVGCCDSSRVSVYLRCCFIPCRHRATVVSCATRLCLLACIALRFQTLLLCFISRLLLCRAYAVQCRDSRIPAVHLVLEVGYGLLYRKESIWVVQILIFMFGLFQRVRRQFSLCFHVAFGYIFPTSHLCCYHARQLLSTLYLRIVHFSLLIPRSGSKVLCKRYGIGVFCLRLLRFCGLWLLRFCFRLLLFRLNGYRLLFRLNGLCLLRRLSLPCSVLGLRVALTRHYLIQHALRPNCSNRPADVYRCG